MVPQLPCNVKWKETITDDCYQVGATSVIRLPFILDLYRTVRCCYVNTPSSSRWRASWPTVSLSLPFNLSLINHNIPKSHMLNLVYQMWCCFPDYNSTFFAIIMELLTQKVLFAQYIWKSDIISLSYFLTKLVQVFR